jgi:exosortase/archaeosortase family protein
MNARYSRNLKIQRTHFIIGLAISLIFTLVFAFQGFRFWVWQAKTVSSLLSFAGVPHRLTIWHTTANGPTIEMALVNTQPIPLAAVVIVLIVFVSLIIASNVIRRIPSPVKTITLVVSLVTIFTLLWETMVSPVPPYPLHWVTIDWSCSGVISLCLISIVFAPFLFTIVGPLRVKILWLLMTIGFSVILNILRISIVTATLYYFGGLAFLLLHYLVGAFVDFVYIVAFYSLALFHLTKSQVGEVTKPNV